MSNTSNNWKSQGGINRRSTNNILSNSKQSTSNLTIPQQFGISNTTIQQYGDKRNLDAGSLYKMTENSQLYNNVIAYYPFNTIAYNTSIPNQSLNNSLVNPSNYNLSVRNSSGNTNQSIPTAVFDSTHSQNAIQFRNNSTYLMTNTPLNTINTFGQTMNTDSISTILTFETFIYIPDGTSNFCIFALDDISQNGLYGLNTTGNLSDCFYLWYNKTSLTNGNNTNTTQVYYYHTSTNNNTNSNNVNLSSSNCGIIQPNTWHKLMMVFGGSYIALYIDGVQTYQQPIGGGSYIPQKPIAINLGSVVVTGVNSGPMLLDTKLSLKANTKNLIEYLASPGNGHQYATSQTPNSGENELIYLLSDEYIGFNTPITCETDLTVAGVLNSFGPNYMYAQANFFDTAHFYGNVIFDLSKTVVFDSSAVKHFEIYSAGASTNTNACLLIENAGGINPQQPANTFIPSMLVYNSINQIQTNTSTDNLIFSISGENVSIGEGYGTNTFNVYGNSGFLGNIGIGKTNTSSTLDVSGTLSVNGVTTISNILRVSPIVNDTSNVTIIRANGNGLHNNASTQYNFDLCSYIDSLDGLPTSRISTTDTGNYSSNLAFWTKTASNNLGNPLVQRMTIDCSGNVGIGINIPQSALDVNGDINTSGDIKTSGDINTTGNIKTSGDIIIQRGTAGGRALVLDTSNTLVINYAGDFSGGTIIHKSLDISGTLLVEDVARFNRPVYGRKSVDSSGSEFATLDWIHDYVDVGGGWIKVANNSIHNSNTGGNVGIGLITPNYTLDVSGTMNITENTNLSTLNVSGATELNSTLNVTGDTTVTGSTALYSTLDVSGDTTVTGSTSLYSTLDVIGSTTVTGPTLLKSTLDVSGAMTVNGATMLNSTLDVSGAILVNGGSTVIGDSTVTGTTSLNSTLDVSGDMTVNGATMLNSTLDVSGAMTVQGDVSFNGIVYGQPPTASTGPQFATLDWVNSKIQFNGGWATSQNNIYNANTGGNVGIETSSPQYTLDISGTLNVSADAIIHGHTVGRGGNSQDNTSLAVGQGSLNSANTGSPSNTAIGFQSLNMLSSGSGNTAVGYNAGANVSSGISNTFVGYAATASASFNRSTAIGYNSSITSSDQIVLGKTTDQFFIAPTVYIPGNVGIGKTNPATALDVTGTITATNFNATSDLRLKENISDLSNSLEKICAIRGVEYTWKGDDAKKLQSGVIAQEVNMIIPSAVNTSNPDTMTVNYNAIIGHLIESIKTLKQEVDYLKSKLPIV